MDDLADGGAVPRQHVGTGFGQRAAAHAGEHPALDLAAVFTAGHHFLAGVAAFLEVDAPHQFQVHHLRHEGLGRCRANPGDAAGHVQLKPVALAHPEAGSGLRCVGCRAVGILGSLSRGGLFSAARLFRGRLVVAGGFGGPGGLERLTGWRAGAGRRVRRVGRWRHQGTGHHQQAADQQAVVAQPMTHRGGQHVGGGLGERHVGQGGRHHHVLVPGQGLGGAAGRPHEAQDGVVVAGVHDLALGAQHVHGQALGHGRSQIT